MTELGFSVLRRAVFLAGVAVGAAAALAVAARLLHP